MTLVAKECTSLKNSLPSTEVPVIVPSWLEIMTSAMPAMYPTSTGRDSRLARKPSRAVPASRQIRPTSNPRVAARTA
ncbi:Uncharacterised protein [Mycobacterium tuberculosis]|uniref:Uncharacterized protein n=1 Tax=Mycobacterium tuberculosis TaxID=1773 RepID=A0A0U0UJ63_MYCTX|nr:Uncharacterised protein [Mycobacterium tuberculosis]COZ67433.1 Uncharacterised protein [Mycobacterium tuberculosis]